MCSINRNRIVTMKTHTRLGVALVLTMASAAALSANADPPADDTAATGTKDVSSAIKHDAKTVADAAKDTAKHVAAAAKEMAHEVAATAKREAQKAKAVVSGDKEAKPHPAPAPADKTPPPTSH
jgi:hypothetical protein